jgi:hypothetical protein
MTAPLNGMLFVAADVAAADDADFNDWYDHEHVEERARLPQFVSAARYESVAGGRRYLGLYRTESLAAFSTPAYQAAFGRQTPWSVANLGRMVDPMRRVCAVTPLAGQGSGQRLSVLPLAGDVAADTLAACGRTLAAVPGFVRAYLLTPDTVLSSPLPKESIVDRRLVPLLVIESGNADADGVALAAAARALSADAAQAARYALRWKLFSHELAH